MRFIEFLTEVDLNISYNPAKETPQQLIAKAKKASKTANNPVSYQRQREQEIRNKTKEIASQTTDPLEPIRLQIKSLEQRLARMKMALAQKEQALARQQKNQPETV